MRLDAHLNIIAHHTLTQVYITIVSCLPLIRGDPRRQRVGIWCFDYHYGVWTSKCTTENWQLTTLRLYILSKFYTFLLHSCWKWVLSPLWGGSQYRIIVITASPICTGRLLFGGWHINVQQMRWSVTYNESTRTPQPHIIFVCYLKFSPFFPATTGR